MALSRPGSRSPPKTTSSSRTSTCWRPRAFLASARAAKLRSQIDEFAARWVAPLENSLVERAFRLYLDFDGEGGRVSGDSVRALSADIDALGAYAFHQPGEGVRIVLVNKATTATTARIALGRTWSGAWKLYQFTASSNLGLAASGSVDGSTVSIAGLPARSASLLVLADSDRIFTNGFEAP